MARVILGFLFAPALLPLAGLALGSDRSLVELILVISYASTWPVGIPLFFVFRWRGWLKWWQVTGAAAVCALPASALLMDFTNPQIHHLMNTLKLMGVGAATGLSFWAIAVIYNSALTIRLTRTHSEAQGKS